MKPQLFAQQQVQSIEAAKLPAIKEHRTVSVKLSRHHRQRGRPDAEYPYETGTRLNCLCNAILIFYFNNVCLGISSQYDRHC